MSNNLYKQIQRMVISGGNFKPDTLKPKEVVSLLLDDEEIEQKCKCFFGTKLLCLIMCAYFFRQILSFSKIKNVINLLKMIL